MSKQITKLDMPPQFPIRKRMAAYARVSSGKDSMLHSLSAQVSYYSDLIQQNPEWEYAGVYADEAYTGTKDERPEFQRLIEDCHSGMIDGVITKSISRFARNTVTLLATVRELKGLGIDVYFEEQNIHSLSGEGEVMLTILASFAQEESRSVSENCKWRIRSDFAEGKPYGLHTMLGYRIKNGVFAIIPEEADIVRFIFDRYLEGDGIVKIMKSLIDGGVKLSRSAISEILRNPTYVGDLVLQRTFVVDHLKKRQKNNHGELPMYHVDDNHEGIVSREVWNAVQAEREVRRKQYHPTSEPPAKYPYTGLISCEKCGCNYKRKISAGKIVWICPTFNSLGKGHCASQQIPETVLQRLIAEQDGLEKISRMGVPEANHLTFYLKDGSKTTVEWNTTRRDSWTPEMKEAARQRRLKQEEVKRNG